MDRVAMKGSRTQGNDQGESNWLLHRMYGMVTKSELGLQGTQMADLYTGMLMCLGQVAGKLQVSTWQGQGLYSKGMSHEWSI